MHTRPQVDLSGGQQYTWADLGFQQGQRKSRGEDERESKCGPTIISTAALRWAKKEKGKLGDVVMPLGGKVAAGRSLKKYMGQARDGWVSGKGKKWSQEEARRLLPPPGLWNLCTPQPLGWADVAGEGSVWTGTGRSVLGPPPSG